MAKRIKESKATSEKKHFIKRIFERFGLTINRNQYNRLCSYISGGLLKYPDGTVVKFLDKQSNMKHVYSIFCPDICSDEMIVIWDKLRSKLVTVLEKGITAEEIIWEKYESE